MARRCELPRLVTRTGSWSVTKRGFGGVNDGMYLCEGFADSGTEDIDITREGGTSQCSGGENEELLTLTRQVEPLVRRTE